MRIKDCVAIITGGAQGIGEHICRALLERGGKVSILDTNKEKGLQLRANLKSQYGIGRTIFISCDVTSSSQMKDAFIKTKQAFGHIDIVCNNAGVAPHNEEECWEKIIDVNLKGVVLGTRLALQHMGRTCGGEGGVIINVASMAGIFPMVGRASVYTATKFGVVGFSRSLEDLKDKESIRVNCICPSFTVTEMTQFGDHKELKIRDPFYADIIHNVGLIRPELVASGVMQLIENDTNNGAVMRVTKKRGIDLMNFRKAKL